MAQNGVKIAPPDGNYPHGDPCFYAKNLAFAPAAL